MIQIEYLNDGTLVKHYSDAGVMLLQNETGMLYSDPIDVVPCAYTYTETDEPIDSEEEVENEDQATIEDYQNALREVGVDI
jgi:hypothetical protein